MSVDVMTKKIQFVDAKEALVRIDDSAMVGEAVENFP